MIKGVGPALTALQAFGKKLEVTANNVANVNTEDFKKSRVLLQEVSPSGVTASVSRVDAPGAPLPFEEGNSGALETSNVDLGEEMVNLLTTRRAFEVNLKTVQTGDELLGSLLDIVDR